MVKVLILLLAGLLTVDNYAWRVSISLAAILATAGDYAASLTAWLYWQRIGWGYWTESWAADLRVMARALIAPWDWRGILYGA